MSDKERLTVCAKSTGCQPFAVCGTKVYKSPAAADSLVFFRFSFGFFPILVDVVLVLALGTAKGCVDVTAQEYFLAILTQPQWMFLVHQHKAEHHLDAQQ